jgi:hypothetical protein
LAHQTQSAVLNQDTEPLIIPKADKVEKPNEIKPSPLKNLFLNVGTPKNTIPAQ